jgi:hypothetical protein
MRLAIGNDLPKPLYRYFQEKRYAEQFMRGENIKLGTLREYRAVADGAVRGDPNDGLATLPIDHVEIDGNNPLQLAQALNIGFDFAPGSKGCSISGLSIMTGFNDAYILCLSATCSSELANEFGRYVIKIGAPEKLLLVLSIQLVKETALSGHPMIRKIDYRILSTRDGLDAGPRGYVKHPRYEWQEEVRLFWFPAKKEALKSRFVSTPHIQECELELLTL